MPNLMPFGKCLADILDREKVSINELTARIGYKSKTSLVRILKGEASAKSLEAFLVRFQASGVGEASDLAALGMALNVARMGKDRYLAWERLWGLFHGSLLACPDGGDVYADALANFADSIRRSKSAEILIINCCDARITGRLTPIFHSEGVGPSLTCEHYFYLTQNVSRTMQAVEALLLLAPQGRYNGHSMALGARDPQALGVLGSDLIAARLVSQEGLRSEQLCLIHRDFSAVRLDLRKEQSAYAFLLRAVAAWEREYQAVSQPPPVAPRMEDYLRLNELLANLEGRKILYRAEPDLCLDAVPPEIAVRALRRDLLEGMFEPAAIESGLERFRISHERRYQPLFNNRCAKHSILTRSAMREFALTGRLAGHVFLMRNFTVEERVSVLQNYLDHARDDGHFYVYFWRDDAYELNRGLSCYDDHMLMMFDPRSDFSLSTNPLAIIEEPTVAALVGDYFRKELLSKRVMPYAKGLKILEDLIEEAKRQKE